MSNVLEALRILGPALTDPWYLVDERDQIVDFNPAFRALFPRGLARSLKQKSCQSALDLPACKEQCLRERCAAAGPVRIGEVDLAIAEERYRVLVTAIPVPLEAGTGALIVLRDLTDEARVQSNYRQLIERAEHVRSELDGKLSERTRQLLAANEALTRAEEELAMLKREQE